jgi:hypothetical protein
MIKKSFLLVAATAFLAGSMTAQAQYEIRLIDHPGASITQVFGINDRGDVTGNGIASPDSLPFVYDPKKDRFTDIAPLAGFDNTSVLGTDDAGNLVGAVTDGATGVSSGYIRDKKGNFTLFDHPSAISSTNPRAVNNKGLVTGFYDDPVTGGFPKAFIYDTKSGEFTDPLGAGLFSIAQGINSKGETVGSSFFLAAGDPCDSGLPFTSYAWYRNADGDVTYFTVNGLITRARGINDHGQIAGFVLGEGAFSGKGFVVELDGSQCQAITIADEDLISVPGKSITAQGINNRGDIVGGIEEPSNEPPGFRVSGFIATK